MGKSKKLLDPKSVSDSSGIHAGSMDTANQTSDGDDNLFSYDPAKPAYLYDARIHQVVII
jgi:hypothetical protein